MNFLLPHIFKVHNEFKKLSYLCKNEATKNRLLKLLPIMPSEIRIDEVSPFATVVAKAQ